MRTIPEFSQSDLDNVYLDYPKKVGKKKAIAAIASALNEIANKPGIDNPVAFLRSRVQAYAKSVNSSEEKFIPHPTTWCNQGRYEDPIIQARTNSNEPGFKS